MSRTTAERARDELGRLRTGASRNRTSVASSTTTPPERQAGEQDAIDAAPAQRRDPRSPQLGHTAET
jgi:hypothetical protein